MLPGTLRSGGTFSLPYRTFSFKLREGPCLSRASVSCQPPGHLFFLGAPRAEAANLTRVGDHWGGLLRDGGIHLCFLAPQCPLRPALEGKERGWPFLCALGSASRYICPGQERAAKLKDVGVPSSCLLRVPYLSHPERPYLVTVELGEHRGALHLPTHFGAETRYFPLEA